MTTQNPAQDVSGWKLRLRNELRMSAMKTTFTFTRDEVIDLMGETAVSIMAARELQQAQVVGDTTALVDELIEAAASLEAAEAMACSNSDTNPQIRALEAARSKVLAKLATPQSSAPVVGADVARLMELVYVPGAWRCPKCNLRLIASTLSMGDGGMYANNNPQECANGCGSMWRVTEREDRQEAQRFAIEQAEALTTPQSSAPVVGDEPDMFWDDNDPEFARESIDEVVHRRWEDGALVTGDTVTVQRAIRLANLTVIATVPDEYPDGDTEITYTVVESALTGMGS